MKKLLKHINIVVLLNIFTPLASIYILTLYDIPLGFLFKLLAAILIHESGHYLVMKYYGYRKVKIVLVLPFGAFVSGEKEHQKTTENLILHLAGPIPGIIIGIIALFLYNYNIIDLIVVWNIGMIFLIYNAVNLLPFYPMDGGRFITELFKITSKHFFIKILISTAISISAFLYFSNYWILILPVLQALTILLYIVDKETFDNFGIYDITKQKAAVLFIVYLIFLTPGFWFVITL